ncbi:MAG: phosphoribosylamine--glycine ligase [Verrucomicrobiota bacterium]
MKVLIVGSGGREHALGWKLAQDPRVTQLFFAQGNAGTACIGENIPIKNTDVVNLTAWANVNKPDLTVVGPEAPLCAGLVDELQNLGLKVFGPNKKAAQLEGSKHFTKELLTRADIPTATSHTFTDSNAAREYLQSLDKEEFPIVVKADGLASGKGVIISQDLDQALAAIQQIMDDKSFSDAGSKVVIEEFLTGQEASIHAFTDGQTYQLLPTSQDHKRIFDHDQGPNTGGMGAYAPAPLVTPEILNTIKETIFKPLLAQFQKDGIDYKGVLYGGLMIEDSKPKVLEFNCRFGDPETQVLLPLLETPLLDLILAVIDETLDKYKIKIKNDSAVTIVSASQGYPEQPRTGDSITGLETNQSNEEIIFHAGTKKENDQVVTAGGRVLACTALGQDFMSAREKAYKLNKTIQFDGRQYRNDIGQKAIDSMTPH